MNRSLQRRLTLLLGAAIMISGLVSALVSFILAYAEAKDFQDDTLRQVAHLALRNADSSQVIKRSYLNHVKPALNDKESLISIIHIPGDPRPSLAHKRFVTRPSYP